MLLLTGLSSFGVAAQSGPSASTELGPAQARDCAPMQTDSEPVSAPRLIGARDPVHRLVYGPGDRLVIDSGSADALQIGQQYFVRRLPRRFGSPGPSRRHPAAVHTVGRVRIESLEANLATATVVVACDGMLPGDYLEPFTPVAIAPADHTIDRARSDDLATVLSGDEDRTQAAPSEWMVIDRGSRQGIEIGDRVVILRSDPLETRMPLIEVAEGVVILVRPETATVEITRARDAVRSGDRVAVRN